MSLDPPSPRAPQAPRARRRLALVVPSLSGGGAERVMVELANEFSRRGHDVDLIVLFDEGEYFSEVGPGVRLRRVFGRSRFALNFALPFALIGYFLKHRPDAVLATLSQAVLAAWFAHRLSFSRARIWAREANHPSRAIAATPRWSRRMMETAQRAAYAGMDGVIAISQGVADDLVARGDIPRERVVTILNPVDVPSLLARAQDPVGSGERPLGAVVISVGRLVPQKNHVLLLEAFALLAQRMPASLRVLGEGPELSKLQALAARLGIQDRVDFLGFRPNPFPWIRSSDVLAISSDFEGLGNALLQAMALGVPVVSTDCPSGPRQVLDEGRLGVLVPVGDAFALAAALERQLDPRRRVLCPPSALESYSPARVGEAYLSVLLP